jgi:hypothetical protein
MKHEALINSKGKRIHLFPHFNPQTTDSLPFGAGFMTTLTDLGFSKGIILETVVSTYNTDGQPNAAPMGAIMESPKRLAFRIYTSSLTYKNLQSKRCGVVNVTSDPEMFYRTAFKETNPNGRLPLEWFRKAETVDAASLRAAEAHVEVVVADMAPLDAKRAKVLCDVKLIKASAVFPQAYCRALSVTIEAVIHATRVKAFMAHEDRQKREQALKLLETIRQFHDVVNRVAPCSRYSKIMEDLNKRVDSWRAKSESLR